MSNENQHWVSKFLVKNFADADGRVYSMDIRTGTVIKAPPKRVASEPGFYEFLIDGQEVSFEGRLEALETSAAPVLKRIVNSRSTGWLSQNQKAKLANFMAVQSFRTQAFYEGMSVQLSRRQFGPTFSELWRSAFIVAHEIVNRSWIVMSIEDGNVFYLGDHPLVLQNTEHPGDSGGLGFDVKGIEVFLPLSPKCALYMPCQTTSEEIRSGYETALRRHQTMRSAAIRGIAFAGGGSDYLHLVQRVIGNSHAIYKAIVEGAPVTAKPENVENLNYLQCAWSHTALFSNQRDFAFARRVFAENPQYRDVPQTRIALKWPEDFERVSLRSTHLTF